MFRRLLRHCPLRSRPVPGLDGNHSLIFLAQATWKHESEKKTYLFGGWAGWGRVLISTWTCVNTIGQCFISFWNDLIIHFVDVEGGLRLVIGCRTSLFVQNFGCVNFASFRVVAVGFGGRRLLVQGSCGGSHWNLRSSQIAAHGCGDRTCRQWTRWVWTICGARLIIVLVIVEPHLLVFIEIARVSTEASRSKYGTHTEKQMPRLVRTPFKWGCGGSLLGSISYLSNWDWERSRSRSWFWSYLSFRALKVWTYDILSRVGPKLSTTCEQSDLMSS